VSINHGRFDVPTASLSTGLVAEEFLDGADVVMGFQEVGGKGVAELESEGINDCRGKEPKNNLKFVAGYLTSLLV
jgi:hypothetical protein